MLNFWEKDFEDSIEKHKDFLLKNLEDQNTYSSKFSQIFEEMDIFQSDEDNEMLYLELARISNLSLKN